MSGVYYWGEKSTDEFKYVLGFQKTGTGTTFIG